MLDGIDTAGISQCLGQLLIGLLRLLAKTGQLLPAAIGNQPGAPVLQPLAGPPRAVQITPHQGNTVARQPRLPISRFKLENLIQIRFGQIKTMQSLMNGRAHQVYLRRPLRRRQAIQQTRCQPQGARTAAGAGLLDQCPQRLRQPVRGQTRCRQRRAGGGGHGGIVPTQHHRIGSGHHDGGANRGDNRPGQGAKHAQNHQSAGAYAPASLTAG